MSATLILRTTSPGNSRLGIPPALCGEFAYDFATVEEAVAAAKRVLDQEKRSRPRQRLLGKHRWLCDHPKQRAIYPLTIQVKAA